MIRIFLNLFRTRRANRQIEELLIESDMPLTVKGIPYHEVLKMKRYLENLRAGQSFPIHPKYEYTVRKIANQHFQEYKISIRNTGQFRRVFRLA